MIKIDTLYLFLRRTISWNYLACTKYKRQDVSFDKFLIGFIHCDRVNLLKIPKIDSIVTQKSDANKTPFTLDEDKMYCFFQISRFNAYRRLIVSFTKND